MHCNGCVSTIRGGLEADDRVNDIEINLKKKKVSISGQLNSDEAAEIIRNVGYSPEPQDQKKGIIGSLFSR